MGYANDHTRALTVASAIQQCVSGQARVSGDMQLVKSTVGAAALCTAPPHCVVCITVSPSTPLSSHPLPSLPSFSQNITGGKELSLAWVASTSSLSIFGSRHHTTPCPAVSNNTTRPPLSRPRPPAANQLKPPQKRSNPSSARLPLPHTRQASKMAWTKPSTTLLRHHRCPVLALLLCLYALVVESFMVPTHTKATTTTRRPRVAGAVSNSRLIRGSTVRRFF